MKVFDLDRRLIDDYSRFSRSFVEPRARDIRERLNEIYKSGQFWPEPLISINPHFQSGATVSSLVKQGTLHPHTASVFRVSGNGVILHKHQEQAVAKASRWRSGRYIMSIPDHARTNFKTLLRAAKDGNPALVECTDTITGILRYVICAVGRNGEDCILTPSGHLADGNPYDAYLPPDASDRGDFDAESGRRFSSLLARIFHKRHHQIPIIRYDSIACFVSNAEIWW